MATTQPASPVCPECGQTNTMVLSDGMARCFDDQHEWNPAEVTALPRPTLAPFQMATVEEVFGPPPGVEIEPAPLSTDELVGGTARMEGGQLGTVVAFHDGDMVVVRLNDGRLETIPLADVETITPRAPEYVVDVPTTPDTDPAEWITDVVMLSDLILAAGLATIYGTDDGLSVGKPPEGWLPRDASTNALIEAAAAVAVARLVVAYEIDVDDVASGLKGVTPEPTKGDQNGESE